MAFFYLRHPVLAVNDILGLPVSAPHVRIAIREEWEHNHVVKLLSRGLMKTTLDAIMSLLSAVLRPGTQNLSLGPTFRQGKFVFEQAGIEKMIRCEMGVQDRTAKYAWLSCKDARIIKRGVDMWKIEFKNGSSILTAPIGATGDNIRGLRAHTTRLDEFKDFSDRIVNRVIKPMSNVLLNPLGGDENTKFSTNKFVYSGTIGYADDHYSGVIEEYRDRMDEDGDDYDEDYIVIEFNYEDCYYLDSTADIQLGASNVDELIDNGTVRFYYRINLSEIIKDGQSETVDIEDWLSENKNVPLKLGNRYFSRDLIDSVSSVEFTSTSDPTAKYKYPVALREEGKFKDFSAFLEPILSCDQGTIMGVDPARESDKTAIVIIRPGFLYGDKFSHIVYAHAIAGGSMTIKEQAVFIRKLQREFNVMGIYMDKKGNGVAMADELAQPDTNMDPDAVPILDPEFDERFAMMALTVPGNLPILHLLNPTVELNTVAASRLRAAFQNQTLLIPKPLHIQPDPRLAEAHRHMGALRGQLIKVKHKTVAGGLKFYIPEYKSKDESLEKGYKDLFSANLYAYHGIWQLMNEEEDDSWTLKELDTMAPIAVKFSRR